MIFSSAWGGRSWSMPVNSDNDGLAPAVIAIQVQVRPDFIGKLRCPEKKIGNPTYGIGALMGLATAKQAYRDGPLRRMRFGTARIGSPGIQVVKRNSMANQLRE